MTQYHSVYVKFLNLQLNELKPATKNAADLILRLSKNMIGINEANCLHNLVLVE